MPLTRRDTGTYWGYGLNIESEIPLSGVQRRQDAEPPDVTIHHARPSPNWAELMSRNDRGDFLLAHLDGALHFWVDSGRSITMTPHRDADPKEADRLIRTMSAGFALALLLRQRGLLALHACMLHKAGRTIGFVGESGWGKSTIAEYFSRHGYDVLSDDVGALEITPDRIRVLPGHPLVKLRRGAAEWLLGDDTARRPGDDGRVHLTKSASCRAPVPLTKLYLLQPTFASAVALEKVPPQHVVIELMRRTHGVHLLTREDYQAALLKQCSEVADRVPVDLVRRKKGLEHLSRLLDMVEGDLALIETTRAFEAVR